MQFYKGDPKQKSVNYVREYMMKAFIKYSFPTDRILLK